MNIVKPGTVAAFALAGSIVGLLSGPTFAQEAPIQFRLAAAAGNPMVCKNLDASLSRVHTVTLMGETALIKSSGGIDDTMKQTSPKVYKTTFALGPNKLVVVADASKTPRALSVTEPSQGCHWNAIAP